MNCKKGCFITFEGPEGAGKSTQVKLLRQALEKRGIQTIVTREPGGTPLAEQLRDIVKYHEGDEPMAAETELLLFAASRAQHVRNLIKPAVAEGKVVICDRFYDSTTAYQGYARSLELDFVQRLNMFAIAGCKPDLTILLDLPPEAGFSRTAARAETQGLNDRLENEALDFHLAVRSAFLTIAEQEPERVKVVSALDAPEVIHCTIMELIENVV
ncbi:MAG: dTMP kinase [Victivallaceae bacterium]|nr:dTMP kinase [Victivallaceae bacterium]